ncbi:hypothetical protein BJ875DRAFT_437170 [Amylocarpus encephaloides]|uniref:Uncharacterized protein n=1 Tax=Amylocarpus encephaloides TaxID=45428 RepID=A0A9P7YS30_9HELO|nr:hypothetical protein BJ875DRAFT_437170 [Amylocarpus encephaloides]
MASGKAHMNLSEAPRSEIPPPAYQEITPSFSLPTPSLSPTVSISFKPIVIPQTSRPSPSAFLSPFTRAYAPSLSATSINPAQFLTFLDALNASLIAGPGLQITSYIGTGISKVPIPIVSSLLSTTINSSASYMSRSSALKAARLYLETANEELFNPRGLRVRVLRTPKMMQTVGKGGLELELPVPLEGEDVRMRRVRALGGVVGELTLDGLPEPGEVEGWWKRTGRKEAERRDLKMQKSLVSDRARGETRRSGGREERVDMKEYEVAQKIYWVVVDRLGNGGGEDVMDEDGQSV